MKSERAKVLHRLCGRPMLEHMLDSIRQAGLSKTYVVVGHQAEQVQAEIAGDDLRWVLQAEQRGTGHAVKVALDQMTESGGTLLILNGDAPLVRPLTLEKILKHHGSSGAALTVLTAIFEDPFGYGRIVRDSAGRVVRSIEERDASPEERTIREINPGMYCFQIERLRQHIGELDSNNAQKEYYLPDLIGIFARHGLIVETHQLEDPVEMQGVNSRDELARVEKKIFRRIAEEWMRQGVTIHDPDSVYIEAPVTIGADSEIHPSVMLQGATHIGSGCAIHSFSRLVDSVIEDGVVIHNSCVVTSSRVGPGTTVGPFTHLREHADVGADARVGNFVEIKKSRLGDSTKAAHLAYLGDAEIGKAVNIGAGTITCNYDGKQKHKTTIEDDVFIGSASQLIAPVRVGRGAYVAAGSSITQDVPEYALGIARGRQINKPGWVKQKGRLKPKDP